MQSILNKTTPLFYLILIICTICFSSSILANSRNNKTCDIIPGRPLTNGYGPYDFTNSQHSHKLEIVLFAHFTPDVERLKAGASSSRIIADIDYTLRAIPNYHRALYAMARHQRIEKMKMQATDYFYSVDCYFKRALYMQPNDAIAHMLYAMHMHLENRLELARKEYQIAVKLAPGNPEIRYNAGLLEVKLGNLKEAQKHAEIAYAANYPLPGLRQQISEMQNN